MIPVGWMEEANNRIREHILQTAITYDKKLSLFLKWENRQKTGSFKLRGALNKVFSLSPANLQEGLVACSAGNHGQGVAYAAREKGAGCIIFTSEQTSPMKVEAMKNLGAEVRLVKGGYVEAEKSAVEYAQRSKKTFISPYNDPLVIAGQGTIGIEILKDLGENVALKTLVVPVGGGGLISGICSYFSSRSPRPRIVGVQSEASPFAFQLFHTGSQEGVVEYESIAEGLAGKIDAGSITIPIILSRVDDIILVTEEEIKEAIRFSWMNYHEMIEGSAAVGLAAQLAGKIQLSPALTIITGGNIQPETFNAIIRRN